MVTMASEVKPKCRVCGKSFQTVSNRNKHERVNRKCSEVERTQMHIEESDSMIRHDEGEEGASFEFVLDNSVGSGKRCSFCLYEFEQVFNAQRHLCLLLPGVGFCLRQTHPTSCLQLFTRPVTNTRSLSLGMLFMLPHR